ncbi:MAG: serine hydrolase [Opitutales bacterium]
MRNNKLLPQPFLAWVGMFLLFPLFGGLAAAVTHFPSAEWERYETPEKAGFSGEGLAAVREESEKLDTAALMIIHRGRVVEAWGDLETEFECHSIRKSFLSALYGIQVEKGAISMDATMADLGIDDNNPLDEVEKRATVRMLLKARSGVYHPALYETAAMAAKRPERHSHVPGTFWYYNNWDFNALGTIYEQETGEKLHQSFEMRIAKPIGMTDYSAGDGRYVTGSDSRHPAYPFRMSARDMARFGLLFLNGGKWEGKQLVSESWVKESTASHSDAGDKGGYGYLWWVSVDGRHFSGAGDVPAGTYTGRGSRGHVLAIMPSHDLVVVHRVNTSERGNRVPYEEFGKLLAGILEAEGN